MNRLRLRGFFEGGCCLASALALVALTLSGILITVSAQWDTILPTSSPITSPILTPVPSFARALRVVSIAPEDGSQEVGTRSTVEVTFNQPMVDLNASPESTPRPSPIVIHPWAEGHGEWTGVNVYRYRFTGLDEATRYTITVPAGTSDLEGTVLPEDHTITFATTRPSVNTFDPRVDKQSVRMSSNVSIRFNMPMNRRSVESRFLLTNAAGLRVRGTFNWLNDRAVNFSPDAPLERSTTYQVTLDAGAQADGKELGTAQGLMWQFTVVGLPAVESSFPADGDMAAYPAGKLIIQFSVPMDTASVEAALRIEPEPEYVDVQWYRGNTRMEAYVDFDPSTEYRVLLADGAVDVYGEPLTGNRSIVFRRAPMSPMLSLYGLRGGNQGPMGSYVADQTIEQFIEVRNLDAVTYTLSTVEPDDHLAAVYHDRYDTPDTSAIHRASLRTWTQTLDLPLNRIKYISTTVTGPDGSGQLDPGIYLLETRAQGMHDARFMIVSRANLALKWGPRQVFVWATDLTNSQVISGMHITVYDHEGTPMAEGMTGDDGVFVADIEDLAADYRQRWEQNLLVVGEGPRENDLALCASHWDTGITVWDFGLQQDRESASSAAHIYSDRPIYRPGQTVYFKGIVRADDDGRYDLLTPVTQTIPVNISDSQGNELFSDELSLTEFGTIHGELSLANTAPLGRYTVQANLPGRREPVRLYFTVSEYRKPEFKVGVSANQTFGRNEAPYPVHGDTITVTVQADYYFGQPVPDAHVRWRMYGNPYRFSLPGVWYNFGSYSHWWYYGESDNGDGRMAYTSGEGRTDEDGKFEISIPVDLSQSNVSQIFAIEATLTDANDQEVSDSTVVVAHKTDTYLGLRPRRYVVAPNAATEIELIALDPFKEPRAGITVTVELYNRRWDSVREKTDSGSYVWRNNLTEELLSTQVVTTTADGKAQALVTPPTGGEFKVVARTLDGSGNEVTSYTYQWVWGRGYINWGVNNHDRVQLVADKREYEPGDVAQILVTAPFSGCLALVTVERGGVLHHNVQRLEGTSALIEVPIIADYAPNAFVSVALVKGQSADFPTPIFKLGYVELRVARQEQQLNVSITPDREEYQPGDTATYTIRATDHRGRGVSAELSVGVVDAAVLALMGDNAAPILDAFYYRRGIGVWNAQTLVVSVDRLNEKLEKAGKGGGGGSGLEEFAIRRSFLDTAYWNPVVVTGQDGWAVVSVPLPDDLTTWRLRAKAVTLDTRVGDSSADVVSTKDLLVRPVLPRFFTVGDEASVAALVHNYTGVTQTIQFEMQTTGLQMAGGPVTNTSFVLAPGGVQKVSWMVSVPKTREAQVLFVARALDTAVYDAVEMTLPVHAFAETTALAANESVPLDRGDDERLTVAVELPYDVSEMDELVIETAPSLGAGIRTGLEYLIGYPYG